MNNLNNFIVEKLHINKDSKFKPGIGKLFTEIQNDAAKGGEYHTYSFEDGEERFERGFIYINDDERFFGVQAMNSSKEFEELLGVDKGQYSELDNMEIGDTTEIDDCTIIRIW